MCQKLIPVTALSKGYVGCRFLAGFEGFNPAGGMDVCLLYMCCQVEVSASGQSFAQKIPTSCVCHGV
jgi:hypothetical protein